MSLPFHQISKETKGQCKIFQLAGASQLRFGTRGRKSSRITTATYFKSWMSTAKAHLTVVGLLRKMDQLHNRV